MQEERSGIVGSNAVGSEEAGVSSEKDNVTGQFKSVVPFKERFLAMYANAIPVKGSLETPCLKWMNSKAGDDYGQFWLNGRHQMAHRVAWRVFKGEDPAHLRVLHKCDNAWCVAIDHLFLGTQRENIDDMKAKGREPELFGEKNGNAFLKEKQVLEIYDLAWSGRYTQREIGNMFGVTQACVRDIKYKKTWQYLTARGTNRGELRSG